MTHEMELARAAGLPTGLEIASSSSALPVAATPGPQGLKKIHRLLRGRYPLAIGLGLVVGLACAIAAFVTQHPMYQSDALIEIKGSVPGMQSDTQLFEYHAFVKTQTAIMQSHDMVEMALDTPEWKATHRPRNDKTVELFQKYLTADLVSDTDLIKVSFIDADPGAAQAGVAALCDAYKKNYEFNSGQDLRKKLDLAERRIDELTQTLRDAEDNVSNMSKIYGSDSLEEYLNQCMSAKEKMEEDLRQAQLDLETFQSQYNAGDDKPEGSGKITTAPLTKEQIAARGDARMQFYIQQRQQLQTQMDNLKARGLLEHHPSVITLQAEIETLDGNIQAYVEECNQHPHVANSSRPDALLELTPEAQLKGMKTKIAALTTAKDRLNQENEAVVQQKLHLESAKALRDQTQRDLDAAKQQKNNFVSTEELSRNMMEISSQPGPGVLAYDKRIPYGAGAFVGGFLLPTLVLLLIGLLDRRFRYSDEANGEIGGVPLLGILPNLPDLLTDPEQAATAAHCVHQIRTILQITGHSTDRRVFAVTSASPGDGKTSLSLALGLSFSASGSRTLLIDGDLVGGGLTGRLNIRAPHGVLEAMSTSDITPLIHPTDVNGLSLLPVGEAMGSYTGTVSPAAVRRMVTEARKQFDVIIVDTGPILGSIEASPVAVAADAVVLCVSRGQQRPLVDRALAHLQAIGARLAGVVFNRAQTHDFEQSVSHHSLRRLPVMNADGGGDSRRMGPVAKAVASSVRPNGNGAVEE